MEATQTTQQQTPPTTGGRRTRSQVAPSWTVEEAMVLVNEISAVEGDCLKALSSYQKWKIIVENCNALGVVYTSNQCRRKWETLVEEYKLIRKWESGSGRRGGGGHGSYWEMEGGRRRELGLPEDFGIELFKAVDGYVRKQMGEADTDPDSDPEAQADVPHAVAELGSKRQRRRSLCLSTYIEDNSWGGFTKVMPQEIPAEEQSQRSHLHEKPDSSSEMDQTVLLEVEVQQNHLPEKSVPCSGWCRTVYAEAEVQQCHLHEKPDTCIKKEQTLHAEVELQQIQVEEATPECLRKEEPCEINAKETPIKSIVEDKPKSSLIKRKRTSRGGDQLIVEKLQAKAEMIHSIVESKLPEMADLGAANFQKVEDFRTDFIRHQADNLIACLRDMVNTLKELPHLVQGSE